MVLYEQDLYESVSINKRKTSNKKMYQQMVYKKVMFLVEVSQPRQDRGRKVLFDGKLGC